MINGEKNSNQLSFDDAIFRQRERTVDNIKRIYAVVYSISFTNVLRDIVGYYESSISGVTYANFTAGLWLRVLMLLIFTSTISVFAFQADKFLDLRYALRPANGGTGNDKMLRWKRGNFAWEAVSLICSLVPFILMSFAFEDQIIQRLGILPFLAAYILLFGLSLFFLQTIRFRYLLARWKRDEDQSDSAEAVRYSNLTTHWFLTNGLLIVLLMTFYRSLLGPTDLCGTQTLPIQSWTFVIVFTLLAAARNVFDYRNVWPFLYSNGQNLELNELTDFMRWVRGIKQETFSRWDLCGPAALCAIFYAFVVIGPALNPSNCPMPKLSGVPNAMNGSSIATSTTPIPSAPENRPAGGRPPR